MRYYASMTGYTKLFSTLVHSSVWAEPDHVRLVWVTLLAMCDQHGRVRASVPGIANASRVSLELARKALERLSEPDPDSSSPEYEGRRIEAAEGGWRVLNYVKYRNTTSSEHARAKAAERQARWRAKRAVTSTVTDHNVSVTRNNPIAEAEYRKEKVRAEESSKAAKSILPEKLSGDATSSGGAAKSQEKPFPGYDWGDGRGDYTEAFDDVTGSKPRYGR